MGKYEQLKFIPIAAILSFTQRKIVSDNAGRYGFLCVIIKGPIPLVQLTAQRVSLSGKLSRLIDCTLNVGLVCFRFVVGIKTHISPIILMFYNSIHV